jgi:hydroxyacylglutathione hydrolase
MNADQPVRPANIANIVAINQGHRPLTMVEPRADALAAARVADLQQQGQLVIDTRGSADFGAGHVPGSFNLHVSSPEFEQRVGWVTPLDVPFILVVDDEHAAARAMHALAFVGLDARVAGYLSGGMAAWTAEGRPVAVLPQLNVHELDAHLRRDDGMKVLDVREPSEWHAGHVAGSVNLSFKHVGARYRDLPFGPDATIAVICHSGSRSSTGASILRRAGFARLMNVTGGMQAWRNAGLTTVDAAGCAIPFR